MFKVNKDTKQYKGVHFLTFAGNTSRNNYLATVTHLELVSLLLILNIFHALF